MLISNLKIEPPLILAPMAGISNQPFRLLCKEMGCGLLVSEMISAKGLIFGSTKGSLLDFHSKERPFAYQLFGSNKEDMVEGARLIEKRKPDIIDINMGCPVNKVVKDGSGSALLKEPQKAYAIIKAVVNVVEAPVTVKVRKGWNNNDESGLEVALLAQEAGAAAVTVHGRSREQMYAGKADWDFISKVARNLEIPVIGNGDISTPQDIGRVLADSNCQGAMLGRGAWGNPWIFWQGKKYLSEKSMKVVDGHLSPSPRERIAMAKRHLQLMIDFKGEKMGVMEMRRHCGYYLKGLPGGAKVRRKIYQAETPSQMEDLLDDFIHG